jgi:hypothetical protein
MNFIYLNLFLITLFISLLSQIQSQDNQESKLKEVEENISQINSLYQNLTEKMAEIKYNVILKLRYKSLTRKKEKVEKQLNKIKSSGSINSYTLDELNEYVYSYGKSCRKVRKLFDTFESLKNTILNIIRIFFLTLIITIIVVIIISALIYLYIVRKSKSYDILNEEMSNSEFHNSNDPELEIIKKKNKKKKFKKKKSDKEYKEGADSKEKVEKKSENIEVLDDK